MDSSLPADVVRLRPAYVAERTRLLAGRVPFAVRFFLAAVGAAAVVDAATEPGRIWAVLTVYSTQLVVCVLATVLIRTSWGARQAERLAGTVAVLVGLMGTLYLVFVGAPTEEVAVVLVCMLAGSSILLPWGARAQLAVSSVFIAAFFLAVPWTESTLDTTTVGLPVVAIGILAVTGAFHLDRYREDAFVRAILQQEEAETTATVLRIGEVLHAGLHDSDLLDRICRVAQEAIGCDWSGIHLWDEEAQAFRMCGLVGRQSGDREALERITHEATTFPLFEELEQRELVEIKDADRQALVPIELMQRYGVASAIYTPIRHRGQMSGVLMHGFVRRRGPFSERQRRVAIGVAHTAAVAVENARLIDQLAAANRLKSEFVATMSHELRTPISVISGYTDLLEDGSFGPVTAEQQDTLMRLKQSTIALLELVNTTLDLSRLESGQEPVTPTEVDVAELAEEIRSQQQPLVPDEVTHTWKIEPGLTVYVDRNKVKAIIRNLVGNALKFTTAGSVAVRISWHDGTLDIEVQDTGLGIAAGDLGLIFEMFRQVDGSSTRRHGGVGLGLHIVKRFVEVLEGTVDVESEEGAGSTFHVSVPCRRIDVGARVSA